MLGWGCSTSDVIEGLARLEFTANPPTVKVKFYFQTANTSTLARIQITSSNNPNTLDRFCTQQFAAKRRHSTDIANAQVLYVNICLLYKFSLMADCSEKLNFILTICLLPTICQYIALHIFTYWDTIHGCIYISDISFQKNQLPTNCPRK